MTRLEKQRERNKKSKQEHFQWLGNRRKRKEARRKKRSGVRLYDPLRVKERIREAKEKITAQEAVQYRYMQEFLERYFWCCGGTTR